MQGIAKRFGLLTIGIVAGVLPGCRQQEPFRCKTDDECRIETIQGFCEANRYCSFPAADCESERRYGGQAGDGLAGECVPVEDPEPTTGATATDATSSTTPPDPSMSSSTTSVADTTGAPTTTSGPSSEGTSTAGSETTSDPMVLMWEDNFERADSSDLGNGWIERSPGTFRLDQGRVIFDGLPMPYQDSVFYRPFDEALLDLDISIEFTPVGPFNFSTPQLHTRIQEDSLGRQPESINAYLVYISTPDRIDVSRVEGDTFALNASEPIDPPLLEGNTYRLSMRVAGTDPVEVIGRIEGLEGLEAGAWTPIQTVLLTDDDDTRIVDPGSFGASGNNTVTFEYDNFTVLGVSP